MTPEQSIKKPLNNHNTNQTIFLVCCLWQRAGHADEKRGKDKERGEVDAHNCLKEEFLEVVCGVDDDEDKESGQVGGQQLVDDPLMEVDVVAQIDAFVGPEDPRLDPTNPQNIKIKPTEANEGTGGQKTTD